MRPHVSTPKSINQLKGQLYCLLPHSLNRIVFTSIPLKCYYIFHQHIKINYSKDIGGNWWKVFSTKEPRKKFISTQLFRKAGISSEEKMALTFYFHFQERALKPCVRRELSKSLLKKRQLRSQLPAVSSPTKTKASLTDRFRKFEDLS